MRSPDYNVEVLNANREPITELRNFVPLDQDGNYLEYGQRLSGFGNARFRLATKDPVLQATDILRSNRNHIRIWRNNSIVWQGIITRRPHRTRLFQEVQASEYLYLFRKVLLRRDAPDGNGGENYRTFRAGTMAEAITNTLNQAKEDGPSALSAISYGTVTNPVFPPNFTDVNNNSIAGQNWVFSDAFPIKFDYRDILFFIDQLALYSASDYELTKDLIFNFKDKIGTDKTNLVFSYGQYGQIEDYDIPEDGYNQANYLIGLAADNNYNILKKEATDQASILEYGKLMDVAAYDDVKNDDLLLRRLQEELRLSAVPDAEFSVNLNENAYPIGQYDIGDTVTFDIDDYSNHIQGQRRIIDRRIKVHNTGREHVALIANKPRVE